MKIEACYETLVHRGIFALWNLYFLVFLIGEDISHLFFERSVEIF